jgi:hypothetical protein
MTTRYLICGGRDFADYAMMERALKALILHPLDSVIIHGGARGADTLAGRWGQCNGSPVERYVANWDRDGNPAGILRNIRMLKEGKPDVVVAFPGGTGTAHMVKIAREAGVIVIEVTA